MDVKSDLIKDMSSQRIQSRLQALAKNIAYRYDIKLEIIPGRGSYCGPTPHGVVIVIDPLMGYEAGITKEELFLRMTGMVAHEAGHILFSDFKEVEKISLKIDACKKAIPKLAKTANKSEIQTPISKDNQKILAVIKDYIYYKNLKSMQNSLEDAAIENEVPVDNPRVYGGIVAIRDFLVKKEENILKNNIATYKKQDKNILEYFETEIRHMATIGYRRDYTSTIFLKEKFNQREIDEIYWMCLYARICTNTTAERTAISELLLSKFDDFFKAKSLKFYQTYMKSLNMSASDLINAMDCSDGHTECAIQSSLDPSLSKMTKPQNMSSDYSLDLPDDVEKKIQEKLEEDKSSKDSESDSGSDSGKSSKKNANSSNSKNSQTSKGDPSASQKDGGAQKNSGGNSKNAGENSDDNSNPADSTGQESDKEDTSNNGEESQSTAQASDNENGTSLSSDGKVDSSINKKKLDKKAAQFEAENAKNGALRKYKEAFAKDNARDFQHNVEGGSGKAPDLANNLADINTVSDMHKGIRTEYFPSATISGVSSSGQYVERNEIELKKISNTFSKKLKEVLMYRAKCKKKTALKRGNINDGDLYRVITDARVFKDKTPGILNKARLCVLIDLSGSMSGVKANDALSGAYVLADACQRINVPISVFGHNYTGNCNLYHFIEYENCHKKESKKKLLSAVTCGGNHDSIAIFHSLTDLIRHRLPNEQLVFLVISDGAPAGGNNYFGEPADNDIRKIYTAFEKNYQTKTIGIGIGHDVAHVPCIYKDYLLVPDVSRLSIELLKILKQILM